MEIWKELRLRQLPTPMLTFAMPKHVLYVYAEGYDLGSIENRVESELVERIARSEWVCSVPSVVNQQHSTMGIKAGDIPLRDLGVNLDLPDPGTESPGWFSDVERIAIIAGELSAVFNLDFVLGIATRTGQTEDLYTIDSRNPNLAELRRIVGSGATA